MIKEKYEELKNTPSDINEHLETLYGFALQCDSICEMGVRGVVSTWAFLNANPKKLVCYDISRSNNIDAALGAAINAGIEMQFIENDVLKVDIEETDFLFIDTFHTATQLERELEKHASKVNKFIGFHDTTSFEWNGEPPYNDNMSHVACGRGIWYSIQDFLDSNKDWKIVYRTFKNNGLTVIQKNG